MQWDLLSVSKMLAVEGQGDKCNRKIIRVTVTEEENRVL